MTSTLTSTHAGAYEAAQARLGRPLSVGEYAIDLAANDRTLETAKLQLYRAIKAELRRALREHLEGRRARISMRITPQMAGVIVGLREAGQRAAQREVEKLTGQPFQVRTLVAIPPDDAANLSKLQNDPKLAPLAEHLGTRLPQIEARASTELEREIQAQYRRGLLTADEVVTLRTAQAVIPGGLNAAAFIAARVESKVPGAMAIAADLVSSPFDTGLADVFAQTANLFDAWQYTAIMDAGTCGPCADADGTVYDTWEEAMADMPDGGPNPDCDGDMRCRCRLVPITQDTVEAGTTATAISGAVFDTAALPAGEAQAAVREAGDAIGAVIQIPNPVKLVELPDADTATARLLQTDEIAIHPDSGTQTLANVVTHEYGHYIDRIVLGDGESYWSETASIEPDSLWQALRETPTMQAVRNDEFKLLEGDSQTRNYFLQGREMFARAFHQYIAIRSENPLLLAEIRYLQNDSLLSFQVWQDAEFAPIAARFDRLFAERGLSRRG